jgi:hypothetical protein
MIKNEEFKLIVDFKKKQEEWQKVFLITAVVYLVEALVFIIFGQGETQKCSKQKEKRTENSEELYPLKE